MISWELVECISDTFKGGESAFLETLPSISTLNNYMALFFF